MEKEFIPYQEALALKELGFDEPCFGYYNYNGTHFFDYKPKTDDKNLTKAPLYQQAFRWFREKYGLSGWVNESFAGSSRQGVISIKSEIGLRYYPSTTKIFDTYEEAELACLKELIEIIKNTRR